MSPESPRMILSIIIVFGFICVVDIDFDIISFNIASLSYKALLNKILEASQYQWQDSNLKNM